MRKSQIAKFAKTSLEFKKSYNYQYCYAIGKFRLYIYDNEHHQKIDANEFQIACGDIPTHWELFADFKNKFQPSTPEIETEFNRIVTNLAEGFKKVAGEKGWFRITFNELKYIPGQKPETC